MTPWSPAGFGNKGEDGVGELNHEPESYTILQRPRSTVACFMNFDVVDKTLD